MKTKNITQRVLAGALLLGTMTISSAFALTTSSSLTIHNSNAVVTNAEVTSVSGSIINAVTRFRDIATPLVVTTNASTTIVTPNGGKAVADIHAGDKLNVLGSITSFGSTIGITATKVLAMSSTVHSSTTKTLSGKVESIDTTYGTFVLKSDEKRVTVQTNASTTFTTLPTATTSQNSLTSLIVNSKVTVRGAWNNNKTVFTATNVTLSKAVIAEKKEDAKRHLKEKFEKMQEKRENHENNGNHYGWFKRTLDVFNK